MDDNIRNHFFATISIHNGSGLADFGKPLSWEESIRLAEFTKGIPPGFLTPAKIRIFMRDNRLFETARIRRFEVTGPQVLHQVDFSGVKLLRAVDSEHVALRGAHGAAYSNKPGEPRERCWCGAAVDDFSRVSQFKVFIAPGESAELAIDFLTWAWSKKTGSIVHGVPRLIYTDQVGWSKDERVERGLGKLGVDIVRTSGPGEPWKKGKVERKFLDFQRIFENRLLAIRDHTIHVNRLNELILSWTQIENERPHPVRSAQSRLQCWQTVKKVRTLPVNARDLFYYLLYRVVRQRQLNCDGNVFWAPPEISDGLGLDCFRIGKIWYGFDFLSKKRWILQEAAVNTMPEVHPDVAEIQTAFSAYQKDFEYPRMTPDELQSYLDSQHSQTEHLPPAEEEFSIGEERLGTIHLSGDQLRQSLASHFGPQGLQAIPDDIFELEVKDWLEAEHTEEEIRLFSHRIKNLKRLAKVQKLGE